MAQCDVCGNDYDKAFRVQIGGEIHTFDCFECAVHMLAPECDHCGCRILGHGIESREALYCCAHCATSQGETAACDRVS
jgi:hypothetical protein